jgi:hypothetical protein
LRRGEMKSLSIINDPPYGAERVYNAEADKVLVF